MTDTLQKRARKTLRTGFAAGSREGIDSLSTAISNCEHAEVQTRAVLRTFLSMPLHRRVWWLLTGRLRTSA
jgi:hypothetical protein